MKNAILICSLIIALIFASCPGPDGGADGGGTGRGTGTITINLGQRAAVDAWPSGSNAGLLPYLEHKVTLTNGSITHTHTIDSGKTSATITAAAGTWNVTLEAYYDSYKFSTGTKSVEVKAGMSNPCSVEMKKADEGAVYLLVSEPNDWTDAMSAIASGGNNKSYVIFVTKDLTVQGSGGLTFPSLNNITVTICGDKELSLSGAANLFFFLSLNQKVILQDTDLVGSGSTSALVSVDNGASFTMKGSSSISGNSNASDGGGVYVNSGTFTMQDYSEIYGNTAGNDGGGVYVVGGTFTMQGNSSVSGNSSSGTNGGGGVAVISGGTFIMQGNSSVSGNTAGNGSGGGVYVEDGTFTMKGSSSVSGNDSFDSGGGVAVTYGGAFTMEGGTIYGSNAGTLENKAQNGGIAIYVDSNSTAEYGGAYGNGSIISENGTIPPK